MNQKMQSEKVADFGIQQVQLWVGLRELVRLNGCELRIPPEKGDLMLRWLRESATPERDRLKALNAWMVTWLERCEHAEWKLVEDHCEVPT